MVPEAFTVTGHNPPLNGQANLRRLLFLALPLLVASCAGAPRPSGAPPTAAPREATLRDGVFRTGRSWLRHEGSGEGILVARLSGTPYEVGAAFGRLTRGSFQAQEAHLYRLLRALLPGGLKRALLMRLVALQTRRLDRDIPHDLLLSIAGLADGLEETRPEKGPDAYHRLLSMHAIHDVSQRFVDAPALASSCTGFLASGSATEEGRTLLARNFDFEGGGIFDRQKIVSVVAADGKIPYISVGFAGTVGVVSGLNREGIGLALNALTGGETRLSGMPMTILAANVLQNESTLDGALARIRRAKVFVSDLILLGEAKTGRIVVVEKTPSAYAVREASPAGWIAVANEAKREEVRRHGRPVPAGSTSRRREERMMQLLASRTRPLDVPDAVAMLRDKRGASGAELGPGNRNAIDGLISSHSVVLDLTRRRAWVAAAPNTLGAYVPVDLETVLADAGGTAAASPVAPVPAASFLVSGGFDRYLLARAALLSARRLSLKKPAGWEARERAELERAHRLSPEFAEAAARLGQAKARAGDAGGALKLLGEALAREIAPEPFRQAVTALRDAVAAHRPLPGADLPWVLTPDELVEEAER